MAHNSSSNPTPIPISAPTHVSASTLFFSFLKMGAFTFGGGYAMLSMIKREIVERKHYIEEAEFWNIITIVQSLPGVFVFNTALYIGHKLNGKKGSAAACVGAILPSIVIILLIASVFSGYWHNPVVENVLKGVRPCVVALILAPSLEMARSVGINLKNIWVPIIAVVCIAVFKISPILVLLFFGLSGAAYSLYTLSKAKSGSKSDSDPESGSKSKEGEK